MEADIRAVRGHSGLDPELTQGGTKCRSAAGLCCSPICYALTLALGQQMQFARLKRREFITLIGGAAAWPLTARAQQGGAARRVGVLLPASANDAEFQARFGAFLQGLQQRGWSIGQNVRIDAR